MGKSVIYALVIPALGVQVGKGFGGAVFRICGDNRYLRLATPGAGAGLQAVMEAIRLLCHSPIAPGVLVGFHSQILKRLFQLFPGRQKLFGLAVFQSLFGGSQSLVQSLQALVRVWVAVRLLGCLDQGLQLGIRLVIGGVSHTDHSLIDGVLLAEFDVGNQVDRSSVQRQLLAYVAVYVDHVVAAVHLGVDIIALRDETGFLQRGKGGTPGGGVSGKPGKVQNVLAVVIRDGFRHGEISGGSLTLPGDTGGEGHGGMTEELEFLDVIGIRGSDFDFKITCSHWGFQCFGNNAVLIDIYAGLC